MIPEKQKIYEVLQKIVLIAERFSEQIRYLTDYYENKNWQESTVWDETKLAETSFGYSKQNWEDCSLVPIKKSIIELNSNYLGIDENLWLAYNTLKEMEGCTKWCATNIPSELELAKYFVKYLAFKKALQNLINILRDDMYGR